MQSAIVKSISIEGSYVVSSSGWNVAIFSNFTIVTPTALSSHICKENVTRFRFIENPEGAS